MLKELKEISKALSTLSNEQEIEIFLNEILTESEQCNIAQRWNILKMFNEKYTQRTISEKLGVSLCKVTRGSKVIKRPNSIAKKLLENGRWRSCK